VHGLESPAWPLATGGWKTGGPLAQGLPVGPVVGEGCRARSGTKNE